MELPFDWPGLGLGVVDGLGPASTLYAQSRVKTGWDRPVDHVMRSVALPPEESVTLLVESMVRAGQAALSGRKAGQM